MTSRLQRCESRPRHIAVKFDLHDQGLTHQETIMANVEFLRRERHTRNFGQGETSFSPGDLGDRMYAAVDGSVEIQLDGKVVETIAPGGAFGEGRFLHRVEMAPQFALQMMRVVSERLRRQG
jgi:CRP-like cAMP-binding protein